MKLLIAVPALYGNQEQVNTHLKFMLRSCEIQKIPLTLYGFPVSMFPGFVEISTGSLLRFLESITEYTHILVSDGGDAFFTGPLDEIIEKYIKFGNPPMLDSASNVFFPLSFWDRFIPDIDPNIDLEGYKTKYYPSDTEYYMAHWGGGYIAEIPYLKDVLKKVLTYTSKSYGGDHAYAWRDLWYEGWLRPERDTHCEIFQYIHGDLPINLEIKNGRAHNIVTDSYPCLIHMGGGYTDQITGKFKRITPVFNMIYPGINI